MVMDETKLVEMFKALSHPNRFRLFAEIRKQGEGSFEEGHSCLLHEIMERLSIGAPTVSHHLDKLVSARLIITERQGKYLTCRVNDEALEAIRAFFDRR